MTPTEEVVFWGLVFALCLVGLMLWLLGDSRDW